MLHKCLVTEVTGPVLAGEQTAVTKVMVTMPLLQIHSITARTVPLEFRENLRRGKPVLADSILRLQDSPEH